ncbi:MAG TPA: hypothetical protein DCW68_05330 [Rhodospirillaceae bacterium]|nr:hypothetical protein [Rhodospirillaceae bacterium]
MAGRLDKKGNWMDTKVFFLKSSGRFSMNNTLMMIVVERDHEFDVFEALEKVGVKAFTRLQGTGTGVWQMSSREVDPKKAILLTVIPEEKREEVFAALKSNAKLDEPGRGIAFSLPVEIGLGVGIPLGRE